MAFSYWIMRKAFHLRCLRGILATTPLWYTSPQANEKTSGVKKKTLLLVSVRTTKKLKTASRTKNFFIPQPVIPCSCSQKHKFYLKVFQENIRDVKRGFTQSLILCLCKN